MALTKSCCMKDELARHEIDNARQTITNHSFKKDLWPSVGYEKNWLGEDSHKNITQRSSTRPQISAIWQTLQTKLLAAMTWQRQRRATLSTNWKRKIECNRCSILSDFWRIAWVRVKQRSPGHRPSSWWTQAVSASIIGTKKLCMRAAWMIWAQWRLMC
mgnify:CR=1 FL=1